MSKIPRLIIFRIALNANFWLEFKLEKGWQFVILPHSFSNYKNLKNGN